MPKRKRIKRAAKGFKPPSPKPPEDPLIIESPFFLAGVFEACLTAEDRRKLSQLLIGRRSFQRIFKMNPASGESGHVLVGSDGIDVWLQAVPDN